MVDFIAHRPYLDGDLGAFDPVFLINTGIDIINYLSGAVNKDGLNLKIVNRSLSMPNNDETRFFNEQLSKDVDVLVANKKTYSEIESYINVAFDLKMGKTNSLSSDLTNYNLCKKLLKVKP